jgi:hypothetical protein
MSTYYRFVQSYAIHDVSPGVYYRRGRHEKICSAEFDPRPRKMGSPRRKYQVDEQPRLPRRLRYRAQTRLTTDRECLLYLAFPNEITNLRSSTRTALINVLTAQTKTSLVSTLSKTII